MRIMLSMVLVGLIVAGLAAPAGVALPEDPSSGHGAADLAEAGWPGIDPAAILLDIVSGDDRPQLLQGRRLRPWDAQEPLDLAGPMPSDDDVRQAIVKGVEFLLSQQRTNGSFEVVLTGELPGLTQAADQVFDAVAATSLACIALRYHIAVDPTRISAATRKGAEYVIDRVYRGKLPLRVLYANWRYTLGLKFLHMEYMASSDDDYREDIRNVSRRMVNAMLQLQMSNSEATLLERRRDARIAESNRRSARPAQLGVILRPPTDNDYRGGAPVERVIPDSTAAKADIRPGDRIVEAEDIRIENSLDYYMMEAGWLSGQRVRLKILRDGREEVRFATLEATWPAYLGIRVEDTADGPRIREFLPFSPARAELEVNDLINDFHGVAVRTAAELDREIAKLSPGSRITMSVIRGERPRRHNVRLEAAATPEGWFTFGLQEDDVTTDDFGIIINLPPTGAIPGTAAHRLGLRRGDRVTWIGDTPILGYDHFAEFMGTIATGRVYRIRWVRDGKEMEGECVADPVRQPFDATFGVTPNRRGRSPMRVDRVDRGGPAERAGIRVDDLIVAVNGAQTPNRATFVVATRRLSAGQVATFRIRRGDNEQDISFELPRAESVDRTNEEGGWAYYPQMGESPSFSTAAAILVLMDVQDDMGIRGMQHVLRDPLKAAGNLVESLRVVDAAHGGAETYVYRAGSMDNALSTDIRGCQGRNTICELALMRLRMRRDNHVRAAVDQFIRHRDELDKVRDMEYDVHRRTGRPSPHHFEMWHNAAYYWMFGHYYTLRAARTGGPRSRQFTQVNEICVKALMLTRRDDGTWMDHPSFGALCGTSLALWVLGETEGPWRGNYKPAGPGTHESR